MTKTYHFRNLILWQQAQDLGHAVIQLTKRMSQSWANAVIGRQIIASATSIAANIAEGHGRFSYGAHRNHLSIARGSVAETDSWIDLLWREGVLTLDEATQFHNRCDQLSAMLTTKIRSLEKAETQDKQRIKETSEAYGEQAPAPPYLASDYCS
ncbi:four helix bundle protein [Candidatus Viridilinea mediisalina]|uniref:Four helix bundle protein n=1 Tax=Candidatus Viridilinea mediisalina TaxID=2024553 RepID=A0A2A6RJ75_9CHLR|nr:four helix bundle protein [Candidatus Viridilinea mediisalina]PDW02900.1 hypothetical protein CJ255_11590 [Candidatus Viridilinea mediisalina]